MSKVMQCVRSVGIHDGSFHADEVTACALLVLFDCVDRDKIVRTRDPHKLMSCEYVCDVGGVYDPKRKLFDHHQVSYQGDLSSAGMILLYLRDIERLSQEEYHFFNQALVIGVDAHDNGKILVEPGTCTFSHIIANFNPLVYDAPEAESEKMFLSAFEFTLQHLKRLYARFLYHQQCKLIVKAVMEESKYYLLFDKALPWLESFFSLDGEKHSALFVVMPSGEHWKLRGIPPSYEQRMQVRLPLPEEWGGLLDEDLKRVSGIPGAIFCHKGRFTSVWQTRKDALAALKYTLQKRGIACEEHF